MRTVDFIHQKRDGEELSPEDIGSLVDEYLSGELPEYQIPAFLMAWVNEMKWVSAWIDEENLKSHPMRHVLTMAIGVSEDFRTHTHKITPSSGKRGRDQEGAFLAGIAGGS